MMVLHFSTPLTVLWHEHLKLLLYVYYYTCTTNNNNNDEEQHPGIMALQSSRSCQRMVSVLPVIKSLYGYKDTVYLWWWWRKDMQGFDSIRGWGTNIEYGELILHLSWFYFFYINIYWFLSICLFIWKQVHNGRTTTIQQLSNQLSDKIMKRQKETI